jgi:aspartate racemase
VVLRPVQPKVILGIFGGMGPEATANMYQLIVKLTPAKRDQEHIPTVMFSFPQVPDRTTAIQSGDPSIVPYLVEGVTRVQHAGASFIIIPCNTAHYYYDQMQAATAVPILHMCSGHGQKPGSAVESRAKEPEPCNRSRTFFVSASGRRAAIPWGRA